MHRVLIWLGLLLVTAAPARATDAWDALRGQTVGLMRHGGAIVAPPGTIPPVPGCAPSAVLTEIGREEMRRLGERMRNEGITAARVFVSRQCSAWETATLLDLGPIQHDPALDPPASNVPGSGREVLERAVTAAAALRNTVDTPVILITHRLNIQTLTGIELPQGEILVLRPQPPSGGLALLGRITGD